MLCRRAPYVIGLLSAHTQGPVFCPRLRQTSIILLPDRIQAPLFLFMVGVVLQIPHCFREAVAGGRSLLLRTRVIVVPPCSTARFIKFRQPSEATTAMEELNGAKVMGQTMRLNKAAAR